MQALFALVWVGGAIGFTIFWMVVGWRAMTALESIARTLGRVSSGSRSPIEFP
jgi:hypothetical protein